MEQGSHKNKGGGEAGGHAVGVEIASQIKM